MTEYFKKSVDADGNIVRKIIKKKKPGKINRISIKEDKDHNIEDESDDCIKIDSWTVELDKEK